MAEMCSPSHNVYCKTALHILRCPVLRHAKLFFILEELRLRVFENWVLRRMFGPKRDGVTGEWRKLHNEELNDQCC